MASIMRPCRPRDASRSEWSRGRLLSRVASLVIQMLTQALGPDCGYRLHILPGDPFALLESLVRLACGYRRADDATAWIENFHFSRYLGDMWRGARGAAGGIENRLDWDEVGGTEGSSRLLDTWAAIV